MDERSAKRTAAAGAPEAFGPVLALIDKNDRIWLQLGIPAEGGDASTLLPFSFLQNDFLSRRRKKSSQPNGREKQVEPQKLSPDPSSIRDLTPKFLLTLSRKSRFALPTLRTDCQL
jgi:hypothetical protein